MARPVTFAEEQVLAGARPNPPVSFEMGSNCNDRWVGKGDFWFV